MITQKKFLIAEQEFERELFGSFDENIKLIEDTLSIDVILRESNIVLMGEEKNVDLAYKLMTELQETVINGKSLDRQSVTYSLSLLLEGSEMMIKELDDVIVVTKKGKAVQPKTLGQKKYIELINQNDITFGIGPAGTGKTYLAVAMAVSAFKKDEVSRIVLTRPAVEAGESLGFLPGDLKDKVDPYLRPLYDALFDMLGGERVNKFLERGTIEVAPLAFMRGRTLDNAFIILDEAQNTTPEQMKMFLTRLGFGSKAVVTGDITQTDLPDKKRSGLVQATTILENIKGIGKIELTEKDVVRHELVQRIIISLQILYILLYFATSSINNIYFTFWLSAIISILSLILSMMNIINKGNFKLLFILISITQILFTVFIYLLPEAGIPAPIKLF